MQEALPFLVALVLFIAAFAYFARKRPPPRPRNRYARWNAEHKPGRPQQPKRPR